MHKKFLKNQVINRDKNFVNSRINKKASAVADA